MAIIRVGLVGVGKVARDHHIPVLRASADFELVACADHKNDVDGVANFATIEEMLTSGPPLDAVSICTHPQMHYDGAKVALLAGKHVFLEKPPCATTAQLDQLTVLARIHEKTLFQTWHSRCSPVVDAARRWLRSRKVLGARILWKEDARVWHPHQAWIWGAGGFGVFDSGVNALSILTTILPETVFVEAATLFVPVNCDSPIAADLRLRTGGGLAIEAAFDFRHTDVETWDIDVETDAGAMKLSMGENVLTIDGNTIASIDAVLDGPHAEYAALYRRFAALISAGQSDVDAAPFRLVGDAFLIGKRVVVERFDP